MTQARLTSDLRIATPQKVAIPTVPRATTLTALKSVPLSALSDRSLASQTTHYFSVGPVTIASVATDNAFVKLNLVDPPSTPSPVSVSYLAHDVFSALADLTPGSDITFIARITFRSSASPSPRITLLSYSRV